MSSDDPAQEGMRLQTEGKLDEAVAAYRRAIRDSHARLAAIQFNLGVVLLGQKQLDEALVAAEAACEYGGGTIAEELRGAVLLSAGRADEADDAFARSAELDPTRAIPWFNRGVVARTRGDTDQAIAHFRAAIALVPDHVDSLEVLGSLLHSRGEHEEAAAVHERILALVPDHVASRHLLAAVRGEAPAAPPDGFVAATFDGYAPSFDAHLLGDLAYRAPALLREALGTERAARALDLGCGTGLAGAAIRDLCDHLDGVDLSAGMIAEARKKSVYDELHVADVTAFVAAGPVYDLIVAADVLIYLGDLAPLFDAVAAHLAPRGRFAFTVEEYDGEGWRLAPWARYQHSRAYIESLAAARSLTVERATGAELRREKAEPVAGLLYMVRR